MKTYVITGANNGIGAAVKEQLINDGHSVVGVDLNNADINANLSVKEERRRVIEHIISNCSQGIDGFISSAGVGPHTVPVSLIDPINFFGTVDLISGLKSSLAKRRGVIVAISSNASKSQGLNHDHINALLAGDEDKACAIVEHLDGYTVYADSKNAINRWVRKNSPDYIKEGVRLNAVAPGMTHTGLIEAVFNDNTYGKVIQEFSQTIPYGRMASPKMISDSICFLLSDAARYIIGSILFVDGGQDAMSWPNHF